MNRTSAWSRKANWIALHDHGGRALDRHEGESMTFDYRSPAELFMAKRKGGLRQRLGYRRFATAAEAIRFAVEDFPAMRTLGAWMQVGDERFDSEDIHRLYLRDEYPLRRRTLQT
jgi:hypothetical protein